MNIVKICVVVSHGVLIFSFTLIFLWQSWGCLELFQKGATGVTMSIKKSEDTRFPAIGIAPGWNLSAMADLGITKEAFLAGSGWAVGNFSAKDVYRMIAPKLSSILSSIVLYLKNGTVLQLNPEQDIAEATKTIVSSEGPAHVLHFEMNHDEGKYGEIGITKMILNFKKETNFTNLKIGEQHAGRLLAPEIIDSTYKISSNHISYMTTRYSVINMLDKPTYPCEYPTQHDLYPYDLCSKDYFNSKMANLGCTVPWLSRMEETLQVCEDKEMAKKAAKLYFDSAITVPCAQPCCTMEVDMVNRFSVPTKDNTTELQITFPPTVKYYKELYLYETLSLLAELGGYLGMFLGVSFLDLRILLDYFSVGLKTKQGQGTVVDVKPIRD